MQKFIGIDFDGTIVFNDYPKIGKPIPGAIEWLKFFSKKKIGIILYTIRTGQPLADAVEYLSKEIYLAGVNENPYRPNVGKLDVSYYVDDKAIGTPLIYDLHKKPCVDWSIIGPKLRIALKIK